MSNSLKTQTVDNCSVPAHGHFAHPLVVEVSDRPRINPADFQRLDCSAAAMVKSESQPACVRLDMEDLQCFETVNHQYESWGVTFNDVVAIQPSNPAFPPRSGKMVVISSPKNGRIEAIFHQPVRYVNAFITSSRRTILAAFDINDRPIAHVESPAPNLATSKSGVPPNVKLSLQGANIHRVIFSALDGQMTLDELNFSS